MPTQILATGSTALDSADVTVSAGTPLAVSLKGVDGMSARVTVSLKDDAGAYNIVGELNSAQPSAVLVGPGSYRFTRVAGATCGVYSG